MRFNILKKTLAAFLTFALCTAGMNFAYAEDGEWKFDFIGTARPKGDTHFVEYTMGSKYDGSYALNVVYPGKEADYPGSQLEISTTIPGTVEAGTYDFQFYINKDGTGRGCSYTNNKVEIAGGEGILFNAFTATAIDAASVPSGEANWSRLSTQVTLSETENPVIKFVLAGPVKGCYIDEISLCAAGGGDNLITGGGFETVVQESDVYETANYTPSDVIIVPTTQGGLALSWRNPITTTVKSIELYDVTDGEPVLLSDSFTKTAQAINEYVIDALTAEEQYQFKLLYTYSDVPKMEYFMTAKAIAGATSQKLGTVGSWTIQSNHNNADHPYGLHSFYIDTTESYEGDASMKLMSNSSGVLSDVYTGMTSSIKIVEGEDYQLSFWIKSRDSGTNLKIHLNWEYFDEEYTDGGGGIYIKGTKGTYDWKQVVAKVSDISSKATSISIIQDYKSNGVWLDNIEFKLLDENGEPTGDNLIADGDFENMLSAEVGELSKVTAKGGEGGASFSWKTMGEVDGVNIYQKVGEEWAYRGKVSGSLSGIDFTDLKYQMDYEFKLVPVNADGIEGTAHEVEFATTAPDYMITEPTLYYNGAAAGEVTSGGSYTVKTTVKNNVYTDGMDYELLVGVFKDGALYELKSAPKTIACSPANSNATPVNISVTVPSDGSDYSIEVYHIDSRENWKVLEDSIIFE
ncbi:MAG: hypothetical protein J6C82_02235 [Clostridia bacterium]|nr:hypothetical protein [Clostridia bacterium]